jgi:hypothetical protein
VSHTVCVARVFFPNKPHCASKSGVYGHNPSGLRGSQQRERIRSRRRKLTSISFVSLAICSVPPTDPSCRQLDPDLRNSVLSDGDSECGYRNLMCARKYCSSPAAKREEQGGIMAAAHSYSTCRIKLRPDQSMCESVRDAVSREWGLPRVDQDWHVATSAPRTCRAQAPPGV